MMLLPFKKITFAKYGKDALIFCILATLASCGIGNNHFGETVIGYATDTLLSRTETARTETARIRSLDNDVFAAGTYRGGEEAVISYRLFKPAVLQNAAAGYPLVVVFHGSGAIGDDNRSQLGALQKLFANADIQQKYPAYVLAPQFPKRSSNYVLDSGRHVLASVAQPCVNTVLQLIDSLKDQLNIDQRRIYLVGYSMGASTVINSLSARPDLFAAGISIAGIPEFDKEDKISAIPIWLVHGMDDTENPIGSDEVFYKELSHHGRIRFWKLKGISHGDVFTAQVLKEIPRWLFRQRKK